MLQEDAKSESCAGKTV